MAGITSAGAASGMDFESIISASLQAKKQQLERMTTVPKEEANIELSGMGKLKSALEAFQKSIEALTEDNAFNARKITTNQPTDNPFFTIEAKSDASNGNYDISVDQLASSEKVTQSFGKDDKFSKGELTITLPGVDNEDGTKGPAREIKINVEDGDTLESIRKKINNNDLGVSASIVQTANGDKKLTIDSGLTGSGKGDEFKISFSAADAGADNTNSNKLNYSNGNSGSWSVDKAKDAIITVDGEEIHSTTNTFNGQVSGLKITVNRVTDLEEGGTNHKTYHATVEQDLDGVTKKVQEFVSAYNTLKSTIDSLGKNNTYTDGKNNYDGGDLAGSSLLRTLDNALTNMVSSMGANNGVSSGNGSYTDIFSLGLSLEKDGTLKLDATDFKEGLENNFNAVVNIFSGEGTKGPDGTVTGAGLLTNLNELVETYIKSDGIIDSREEELNETVKRYEDKEADNAEYLTQYEATLRQRYGRLDTTIAQLNNSLMYLQSALG